jgi:F-type H+-transporting ATPase subunit b
VFSIINIIVLFLVLKYILFKPVSNFLNQRVERIKKNISDTESNKAQAEELKREHKAQLDKLKDESSIIINNAHQKAQAEAEEIIKRAKAESEIILQSAREQGQREVEKALEEVKNQVASLALLAASKVIQKNMDTESNRKLVEEFIDEVGVA